MAQKGEFENVVEEPPERIEMLTIDPHNEDSTSVLKSSAVMQSSSTLTNQNVNGTVRFNNGTSTKGLVWGSSTWQRFYTRIDDYAGNLRLLTDDLLYIGDIDIVSGRPTGSYPFIFNVNNARLGIGKTPHTTLDVNGHIRGTRIRSGNTYFYDGVFELKRNNSNNYIDFTTIGNDYEMRLILPPRLQKLL
jgi:hypothetical protein